MPIKQQRQTPELEKWMETLWFPSPSLLQRDPCSFYALVWSESPMVHIVLIFYSEVITLKGKDRKFSHVWYIFGLWTLFFIRIWSSEYGGNKLSTSEVGFRWAISVMSKYFDFICFLTIKGKRSKSHFYLFFLLCYCFFKINLFTPSLNYFMEPRFIPTSCLDS